MAALDLIELNIRLLSAVAIGTVIGSERQMKGQAAGLRTNILVCLAACIMTIIQVLTSQEVIAFALQNEGLQTVLSTDFTRITAQIVSGIGFIGAGTILVTKNNKVAGLTTAASLWAVAGLGIAVGMGYYYLAFTGCSIIYIVLSVLKKIFENKKPIRVIIYYRGPKDFKNKLAELLVSLRLDILKMDFREEYNVNGEVTNCFTYRAQVSHELNLNDVSNKLVDFDDAISYVKIDDL